ncbi:hypothetical protein AXX12_02625 [Anaerosporomusa subterranea]|uniref:Uncharacterized protein n=1 Tax=Anaerosporomusa subterranea TaxID=1794912 RepID=A0A154BSZ8_ANASB|nr:hypothetical protein [Anaerosporomusa subterranea]KYZ77052.1 hypothetical protein AXX12_02625 [Anaerosporomusa subterranea]
MKALLPALFFVLISFFSIPAHAEFVPSVLQQVEKPTIAVILGGEGAIRSNEKAMKLVQEKLAVKFPSSQYNLITDSKLAQDILVFTEDEDVEDIKQIKKSQLAKFGEKRNYDYVVMLLFGMGHGRAGVDFWAASYNIDVDMQAKVVDVSTGQYIYRQNIMGHGKSSAAIGMPSSVNAFAKATEKCIETFNKEVVISPIKPKKVEQPEAQTKVEQPELQPKAEVNPVK